MGKTAGAMPAAIGLMSSYYLAYFLGHLRASFRRVAQAAHEPGENQPVPQPLPAERRAA